MIRLVPVRPEKKDLLWNINQKYLYEMTSFYDDEMDELGNYHYGYFEEYFIDPKRKAFFLYNDEILVGFAMIHPYSVIGGKPDFTMAEFTVFPAFRHRHLAKDAAELILSTYRGCWEIKFNEKNKPAKALWTSITAPHLPEIHHLNEFETVLTFNNLKGEN